MARSSAISTITSFLRTCFQAVVDVLICIFCCRCVRQHQANEPLQNGQQHESHAATTELSQRQIQTTAIEPTAREPTTREPTTRVRNRRWQEFAVMTRPSQVAESDRIPRFDNQSDWTETHWKIWETRCHTNPSPVDELRELRCKVGHWSWQWFPAEYNPCTSYDRQLCAFRNEAELMTYYRSDLLFGEFIELAEVAVRYPMNSRTDEYNLSKSLLLCRHAAVLTGTHEERVFLRRLIEQQTVKSPDTMQAAKRSVRLWIQSPRTAGTSFPSLDARHF